MKDKQEAAAAARPVALVGEVAKQMRRAADCFAGIGLDIHELRLLLRSGSDLLTAQAAEIERLKRERAFAIAAHDGQAQDKDCIAGWLAAKDAEIAELRDALAKVLSEASKELGGVEAGGSEIVEGIIIVKARAQELEAALRGVDRLSLVISSAVRFACPDNLDAVLTALKATRAAIAPAGKEPEQP